MQKGLKKTNKQSDKVIVLFGITKSVSQGSWVRYPVWQHTFVSPSAFSRRAVVSYWRKYVHEVLVNRIGGLSLPRKSVVRLTDRPDMTLDVYRGRKTTMQHILTVTYYAVNILFFSNILCCQHNVFLQHIMLLTYCFSPTFNEVLF